MAFKKVGMSPSCEINLEADGQHHGYVRIPFSSHRSAYGWLPVPIMSIKNGDGPTALLIAGNHGDEYEGIAILFDLFRELTPDDVRGRLIILPAANAPAVYAGRRTSPLDHGGEGNLNRLFPGKQYGAPSDMIAWFICSELIGRADVIFDLHSAGSSIDHWPSCKVRMMDDPEKDAMQMDFLKLFGVPIGIVGDRAHETTLSGEAVPGGVIYVSTELGGAGRITPWIRDLGAAGLRRCLKRMGVLRGDYEVSEPEGEVRLMAMQTGDNYVVALEDGLFEPRAELGEEVADGQFAGYIWDLKRPWRAPAELHFGRGGIVFCKRHPALCEVGDTLFFTLNDYEGGN
ncbi:MAG: succinylglutamate desuccinylase/aspartoacylase family protein [Alphaproteobacteria bacterium]|nr:succinylglutamate desuccinylase/aspartoacylase family protein [Alphaproteobacteria bacterium]